MLLPLRACVPQDMYSKLKKQWKDLQRRHNEFKKVLLSSVYPVTIGDMSFGNVTLPPDCTFLPGNISFTEQVKHTSPDNRCPMLSSPAVFCFNLNKRTFSQFFMLLNVILKISYMRTENFFLVWWVFFFYHLYHSVE